VDCVKSPLLHLPGVKAMLTLALGLPCPKVSWCFARSQFWGGLMYVAIQTHRAACRAWET